MRPPGKKPGGALRPQARIPSKAMFPGTWAREPAVRPSRGFCASPAGKIPTQRPSPSSIGNPFGCFQHGTYSGRKPCRSTAVMQMGLYIRCSLSQQSRQAHNLRRLCPGRAQRRQGTIAHAGDHALFHSLSHGIDREVRHPGGVRKVCQIAGGRHIHSLRLGVASQEGDHCSRVSLALGANLPSPTPLATPFCAAQRIAS